MGDARSERKNLDGGVWIWRDKLFAISEAPSPQVRREIGLSNSSGLKRHRVSKVQLDYRTFARRNTDSERRRARGSCGDKI